MLRHLKNSQELVLYASLSCGAGFLARLVPAFYVPILLLRLGIFAYCFVVIFKAEGNRELAVLIGSALFIGLIGANLDYLELLLRYDLASLVARTTTVFVFVSLAAFGWYQFKSSNK